MPKITVKGPARKAERKKIKAAIGIDGLSGSGKTGLALEIAAVLTDNDFDKVYLADAENESARLYVGQKLSSGVKVEPFYYNALDKETGYSPFNYEFFQKDAKEQGCEVIINDSYSHMWNRDGGVLDEVSRLSEKNRAVYNFNAWAKPDIIKAKNLIFDLIRSNSLHVISTLRIKEAYVVTQKDGQTDIKSVGEKQIQTEGLTFEFDLVMRMISPGNSNGKPPRVTISKSRYDLFEVGEQYDITPELLKDLREYLNEGVDMEQYTEKMEHELRENIKARIANNKTFQSLYVSVFKDKKLKDLSLKELRMFNSKLITLEYGG